MSKPGRRVLLVSHDASRTGAPKVALSVTQALEAMDLERIIILRWGGPLESDLRVHADSVRREPLGRLRGALRRRYRRMRVLANRLDEVIALLLLITIRPDLLYLNTVLSASYIRPALWIKIPIVLHIHEAEPIMSTVLDRWHLSHLPSCITVIACSQSLQQELAVSGRVQGPIHVIPSAVDGSEVRRLASIGPCPVTRPVGGVLIGTCGTVNLRKGVDLWLEVVSQVVRAMPDTPIQFAWAGKIEWNDLQDKLKHSPLESVVTFLGELDNPYHFLASLDLLIHTAREDPYPLVILEALALNRPVVAFDVGGLSTQLANTGILVKAGSVDAMAEAVITLVKNPDERLRVSRGADHVADLQLDDFKQRLIEICWPLLQDAAQC